MEFLRKTRKTVILGLFVLAVLMLAAGLIVLVPQKENKAAKAASPIWDGTIAGSFTGTGTSADPYQIADGRQLALLAKLVNEENTVYNNSDVYYVLTDDIVLNGPSNYNNRWTPIGINPKQTFAPETGFRANFDGKGYAVRRLYINASDNYYQGLFGYVYSGNISNVGVEDSSVNSSVNGYNYCGGIAGFISFGNITNCYNTGSVSIVGANGCAGGIAGANSNGIIANCYNTGSITVDVVVGSSAGGIVGSNSGRILNCYNTGSVYACASTSSATYYLSSYAGGISGAGGSLIINCYND